MVHINNLRVRKVVSKLFNVAFDVLEKLKDVAEQNGLVKMADGIENIQNSLEEIKDNHGL